MASEVVDDRTQDLRPGGRQAAQHLLRVLVAGVLGAGQHQSAPRQIDHRQCIGVGIQRRGVDDDEVVVLAVAPQRLLEGGDKTLELEIGRNHLRVKRDDVTFTSKLIDGRFPDYEAVIPIGADREVTIDRELLRAALQRVAILSNEKYRGVRMEVSPGLLRINAHNPEQEEAQEEVEADTKVDELAVGFNVNYLLDALTALRGGPGIAPGVLAALRYGLEQDPDELV